MIPFKKLTEYDNEAELSKVGKTTFRNWIILGFLSAFIIFSLYLGLIINSAVNANELREYGGYTANAFNTQIAPNDRTILQNVAQQQFIYSIITNLLLMFAIGYAIFTLGLGYYKSVQKQDYIHLQLTYVRVMLFIGLWNAIDLFQYIFFSKVRVIPFQSASNGYIINFIFEMLILSISIVSWIFVSHNIKKIWILFFNIKRKKQMEEFLKQAQKMQNDPNSFLNMMFGGQANSFNADAQPKTEQAEQETTQNLEATQVAETTDPQKEQQVKKLLELPNSQLFSIAKMLKISGYQDMEKTELANLIYEYSKQDTQNKE
ncbi:hypothetical protein [Mycoplasma nasistruthionis]|uniref:Rho termination factor N-terminal domain-containing protein n=1 Tax=Mycoplasma nasistruthionis TaxID=353852 RepID=A0A4Y6I7P1_9MOLU|nr:hypothetical protein [Mycoplasma nasistruthionis]QDF65219.1 hypothetical protein FIV53_02905 [Mycoplasma nasistruthionis]